MKVRLGLLADSDTALQALVSHKLPFKIAYQVAKVAKKVKDELASYGPAEIAILEQFGEPADPKHTGPGAKYNIPAANREAWSKAREELNATEVEVYGEPFALSLLKNPKTGEMPDIEPGVLIPLLDWLLVDDLQPSPAEQKAA